MTDSTDNDRAPREIRGSDLPAGSGGAVLGEPAPLLPLRTDPVKVYRV